MNIEQRVQALRQRMAKRGLEAYIVPTADPHQSEYVSDYYKTREYISGFTGSAGTAVITLKEAGLWTDGRYFLQAEAELEGTPFQMYRMGTSDPTWIQFLKEKTSDFASIGCDGRCLDVKTYRELSRALGKRILVTDMDYVGDDWEDRPSLPSRSVYVYDGEYAGKSVSEKLEILRRMMREKKVDYHLIGSLDDIAYLFNIRGWDVDCTPVVLSYALISQGEAHLFIDENKLPDDVRTHLETAAVSIHAYDEIDMMLQQIEGQKVVYLDPTHTNIALFHQIHDNVKIEQGTLLTTLMKAIKDEKEIAGAKEAYLKDGVALVKFFNWVETGVHTGTINERTATERLHRLREEQEDFLEDSFDAIIGYADHGAIVHYNAMHSEQVNRLETRSLLLVDSGGQYLQGTTDITRTLALGELTQEEKEDYTLVLKAHIAGMSAQFPEGTKGRYIDAIVRYPLYQHGRDFNHGTGHGVGHLLNVHEGPQSFSKNDRGVEIVPGMVTSMEPGLYVSGSHGIRIESITHCVHAEKEGFLCFESLTWVPIDTRPVVREMMEKKELEWLNAYNQTCYEKLAPRLEGEDLRYLKERCVAI